MRAWHRSIAIPRFARTIRDARARIWRHRTEVRGHRNGKNQSAPPPAGGAEEPRGGGVFEFCAFLLLESTLKQLTQNLNDETRRPKKAPNIKLQAPEKPQAPNFKQPGPGFGVWCFPGAWCLEFGA